MTAAVRRNLAVNVIDALLSGEAICAGVFGRQHHVADTNVSAVLRYLKPCLKAERRPKEPGRNRIYYTTADAHELRRAREAVAKKGWNPRVALGSVTEPTFAELLAAWGIAPAQIELPGTVHRMMHEELEMEDGL